MTKPNQKVTEIIRLLGELWEKRADGPHYRGLTNQFANFFNCEVCDTSTRGELSPLLLYTDDEILEHLRFVLQQDEPTELNSR
jgi:hypothetical protein